MHKIILSVISIALVISGTPIVRAEETGAAQNDIQKDVTDVTRDRQDLANDQQTQQKLQADQRVLNTDINQDLQDLKDDTAGVRRDRTRERRPRTAPWPFRPARAGDRGARCAAAERPHHGGGHPPRRAHLPRGHETGRAAFADQRGAVFPYAGSFSQTHGHRSRPGGRSDA